MQTIVEPTLAADRHGLPIWYQALDGPVTGALTFRVGIGDEPLVRRGFTHMVEHLTLSNINDPMIQWNGFVDLNRTVFHATGPQPNVEQFLRNVAVNLANLPLDRLDTERDVLAAEARRRGQTLAGELFSRRYGAQAWGTCAWWEMAVRSAHPAELDHWRRTWFSRGNAVVWMTAEPTADFALDLHDGPRISTPVTDDIAQGPCWFRHDTNVVAFLVRPPRSHASTIGAQVIIEQLQRDMRGQGLCYSVDAAWHRLDLRRAALVVSCDTVPQRESELARGVVDVLDRLSREVPVELIDEVKAKREMTTPDDRARGHLDGWSLDLLLGRARTSASAEMAAENSVARANIRHEIEEMRNDLLLMVPPSVAVSARDLPMYPVLAAPKIEGRTHSFAHLFEPQDGTARLVVGQMGLSLDMPGESTTVMWSHMAGVMKWRDGTRIVIDGRGQAIVVEPTRFTHGRAAVDEIDVNTPVQLAVNAGTRYAPPVLPSAPAHVLKVLRTVRTAVTVVLILCIGAGAIAATSSHRAMGVGVFALGLLGTLSFALVSTGRPSPTVWDNGNRRTKVPDHVDRNNWYIPGGLLLGWAAARDHLAPEWTASFRPDIAAFKACDITGPELYRRMGGVLADDMVDDQTNEFFTDYLAQGTRGYDVDLGRAVGSPRYFEIPDTWQSQAAVISTIDDAHRTWRRLGRFRLARALRRASRLVGDGRWRGPQADAFGERLVQRRRRRRWMKL
jgi:hypothetical protein